MLTALLVKLGFAVGGIVLGWVGKKLHIGPYVDVLEGVVETVYPNANLVALKKNPANVAAVGAPPPKP